MSKNDNRASSPAPLLLESSTGKDGPWLESVNWNLRSFPPFSELIRMACCS